MKPTEEQIKEFWEKCGISHKLLKFPINDTKYVESYRYVYPDNSTTIKPPPIDINNLFKYAVPKLKNASVVLVSGKKWGCYINYDTYEFDVYSNTDGNVHHQTGIEYNEDPALALFRAIREVMNEQT